MADALLPDAGEKKEPHFWKTLWVASINYRTWILMASYGFSFGIELTLDNVLSGYFQVPDLLNVLSIIDPMKNHLKGILKHGVQTPDDYWSMLSSL